eukprot:Nk52_evm79s158 gene=Nk52_evmTU79s158
MAGWCSALKGAIVVGLVGAGSYLAYNYYYSQYGGEGEAKKKQKKGGGGGGKDKDKLQGTVGFYERHVLVGSGVQDWPSKIEKCNPQEHPECSLAHKFAAAINAAEDVCSLAVKLSATSDARGTVTVFPDQIRYEQVREEDVSVIVNNHLVTGMIPVPGKELSGGCKVVRFGKPESGGNNNNQKKMKKSPFFASVGHEFSSVDYFVYVCTHMQRDKACGISGPALMSAFNAVMETEPYRSELSVRVFAISHIGGHRYAGNCIVYENCTLKESINNRNSNCVNPVNFTSPTSAGTASGDWYGFLDAEHVHLLVQEHMVNQSVLASHWRGRMGLAKDLQVKLGERLCAGECNTCEKGKKRKAEERW